MGIADSRGRIKITCRDISSLGLKMDPLWTFYNQKQEVIFEDFWSTFGNSNSWNTNYNPWRFRQHLKLCFLHWYPRCTCSYRNSLQSLHSSMPCALFHTQIPLAIWVDCLGTNLDARFCIGGVPNHDRVSTTPRASRSRASSAGRGCSHMERLPG